MERKELSSNWKKLQQSLGPRKTTSLEKKPKSSISRNASDATADGTALTKKRKRSSKETIPAGKLTNGTMGQIFSKTGLMPTASLALWAEDNDIPQADLALAYGANKDSIRPGSAKSQVHINEGLASGIDIGQYVAMDCEMVGVGGDEDRSVLARVSLVNFHGEQVYDSFVRPKEHVTDWRTEVSGIRPKHMLEARELLQVQGDVAKILEGRILVGHAVHHDLTALFLSHSKRDIRDTSKHTAFKKLAAGRTPGLKKLSRELLGIEIQAGEHSSVEDARACMLLFRRHKEAFDADHAKRFRAHTADAHGATAKKSGGKSKGKASKGRKQTTRN